MRFSTWLSIGIGVGVAFATACGGSVSLGTIGGELGSDGGTSSSGGSSSGGTQTLCSDPNGCGPVDLIACSQRGGDQHSLREVLAEHCVDRISLLQAYRPEILGPAAEQSSLPLKP